MTSPMPAPETVGTDSPHRVELALEADAQMLFLARMTGAAVAARADFDFEQVEDLRLAVDELCIRLMSTGGGTGRITLLFQWNDEGILDVTGTLVPDGSPSTDGHDRRLSPAAPSVELSERILDALVDDHGGDTIGGVHKGWLRMRRRERSAS
jgi:hypothetical protein